MGLWLGLLLGQTVIFLLLLFFQFFVIKWEKEVYYAKQRLLLQEQTSSWNQKNSAQWESECSDIAKNDVDELALQDTLSPATYEINAKITEQSKLLDGDNLESENEKCAAETSKETKHLNGDICRRITAIVGFVILMLAAGIGLRLCTETI